MVLPVVDRDFSQFSAMLLSELHPCPKDSMVGEQLKMLFYTDFALAVGLHRWQILRSGCMMQSRWACGLLSTTVIAPKVHARRHHPCPSTLIHRRGFIHCS